MLRQIAHARGLVARAQEDPTYELPAVWHAVRYFVAASFVHCRKMCWWKLAVLNMHAARSY